MSDIEKRLAALEAKVHDLEDQVALYQLMSAYGPLVDSGDADATAGLWTEDGVYDWGGGPKPAEGTPMKEGETRLKPTPGPAALWLIEQTRAHPGQIETAVMP